MSCCGRLSFSLFVLYNYTYGAVTAQDSSVCESNKYTDITSPSNECQILHTARVYTQDSRRAEGVGHRWTYSDS